MTRPGDESVDAARHRALADPSRLAIVRMLEMAETPVDARTLAERLDLHVNTVRWHLGILVEAALVSEERESSGTRGRPRHGFRIVPGALDDRFGGFRLLADALAEVLVREGEAAAAVEAVGRERGRLLVADETTRPSSSASAIAAVMRLLTQFGFQPRLRRTAKGRRIDMRPCPFGDSAARFGGVVCPLHLGLVRGALAQLGGTIEATELEPFAKPDLCVVHLTSRRR